MTEIQELHRALTGVIESNFERQVAWLTDLVRFDSTRGNEAPCQKWLAGEFATRGWSVDSFAISDVDIAGKPGVSPVVDADYTKAIQVVATLPHHGNGGTKPHSSGPYRRCPPRSAGTMGKSALRTLHPGRIPMGARCQ